MPDNKELAPKYDEAYWLSVIAKALSAIALRGVELHGADVATKGKFLMSLGLDRNDAAAIIQSSAESLRVSMAKAEKVGGAKRGKAGQKGG